MRARNQIWLKYLWILLLVVCAWLLWSSLLKWSARLRVHVIDSGREGPCVLVISGTHGNEPAGRIYLEKWLQNNPKISRGKLIVIPCANKSGNAIGSRYMIQHPTHPDLNRNYTEEGNEPVSKNIIETIRRHKVDFILDFHEGWGWRVTNRQTIGSTLSSTTPKTEKISHEIIDLLNQTIPEPDRKFVLNDRVDRLLTLRNFARNNSIDYILVETTGQDDIQPLWLRCRQVGIVLDGVLNRLGMYA